MRRWIIVFFCCWWNTKIDGNVAECTDYTDGVWYEIKAYFKLLYAPFRELFNCGWTGWNTSWFSETCSRGRTWREEAAEEEDDEETEEEVRPGWLPSALPRWTLTRKRKRGHFLEGLLKVAVQSGLWSWVWWELKEVFLFGDVRVIRQPQYFLSEWTRGFNKVTTRRPEFLHRPNKMPR